MIRPRRPDPSAPPIDPRLVRWRRIRRAVYALGGVLALTIVLSQTGVVGRAGDDWSRYERRAVRVVRVLNGGTLLVRSTGGSETALQLVGVDAPGAAATNPDYWGAESRLELAARVEGREATLRLEATQTRSAEGSLLAHVYLNDTEHVNLELLRAGSAYADRRSPHALSAQFEQAENEARGKRRGLWKNVTESQMPAWRQNWLRDLREKRAAERRPLPASRPQQR